DELRELILGLLERQQAANGAEAGQPADDNLDLTSLELVRLLVNLEDHLDLELDDVDIMNANFGTVEDIVALVSRSLSLAGRAGRACPRFRTPGTTRSPTSASRCRPTCLRPARGPGWSSTCRRR